MRRLALILCRFAAAAFLFAAGAMAQTTEIGPWPKGSVELTEGWRVRAGDDIAWKQTNYDDTAWPVASLGDVQSRGTGKRWYRLHLKLPSHDAPKYPLTSSMVEFYHLAPYGIR